jgi:hypothetical protein
VLSTSETWTEFEDLVAHHNTRQVLTVLLGVVEVLVHPLSAPLDGFG